MFFGVYEEICSYCNIIDNEVEVKFFLVDKEIYRKDKVYWIDNNDIKFGGRW